MNNVIKSGYNPCSSCGMCVVSCSQKAITFDYDENGFYRPNVNESKCTDCGICINVCYKFLKEKNPVENIFKDKQIYGVWSKNPETVLLSSSGGVSYELTKHFYEKGIKICGVIFDAPNNICKHIIANNNDDLQQIKTSKYLQSYTIEAFSQFKKGEKYVVVGTPCQIYGLRQWIKLKKWEENFILVDFFCHGTPSFNMWRKYKEYICKTFQLDPKWIFVNFRKKNLESKWHKNAISIQDFQGKIYEKNQAFSEDLFFKFFLNNSCLNEACYNCKLRLDYCASDIRIADFWGKKYANNDEGVNLIIVNTALGQNAFNEIRHLLECEECNFIDMTASSHSQRFIPVNSKRHNVMYMLKGNKSLEIIWLLCFWKNELVKRLRKIKGILKIWKR